MKKTTLIVGACLVVGALALVYRSQEVKTDEVAVAPSPTKPAETLAGDVWSDREICRAAAKTYFWLSDLPSDAPDQGDYMGYRSAKQNYYTCRVDGDVVDFSWVNNSSEKMRSQSTKIEVDGGKLTVKGDMKTEVFTKS